MIDIITLLYQISPQKFKQFFLSRIGLKDGGEWKSEKIRAIFFKDYQIEVGFGTYGCFVIGAFTKGSKIGNYCSFAPGIKQIGANHPITYATCHPIFYNKSFGFNVEDVQRGSITIGHDVWIGQDVIILPSCKSIGNGAIIGAGSIVTKDVQAYSIIGGNPAKYIKSRFDQGTIELLEKSKWWELSPDELIKFYSLRRTPKQFAQEIISSRHNLT